MAAKKAGEVGKGASKTAATKSATPAGSIEHTTAQVALDGLIRILDLERLEENLFRGNSPKVGWQRVYGGQVLGQAMVAAIRTVAEDRIAHSAHAYFLLPGDPNHPIIYDVERIRDGGSFTTRRVKGIQHGRAMFTMSLSFQKPEPSYDHALEMPQGVPQPEELPNERDIAREFLKHLPENMRSYWASERPIEMRPVDVSRYFARAKREPKQMIWMRANGQLPAALAFHQCVLAYASDFTLLDTALIAHGKLMFDADIQLASLDHAMWFHRPFKADEWLLYVQDSPSAFGARGLSRGSVYSRDGVLVASVAQEGLVRKRATNFAVK